MKMILREENVEEGLKVSRTNSSLYMNITILIVMISSFSLFQGLTIFPIALYENKYLCKSLNSNTFDIFCENSFVCDKNNLLGIDYVVFSLKNSIISDLDIFCDNNKIQMFKFLFYLGALTVIVIPIMIKYFSIVLILKSSLLMIMLSNIAILIFNNYWVILVGFTFIIISFNNGVVCVPIYIAELSEPKKRFFYISLSLAFISLGGIFVNAIYDITYDYKYIFLVNTITSFISVCLIQFLMIEPVRTDFIKGNLERLMSNLEFISKINKSHLEYISWKDNIELKNTCNINDTECFLEKSISNPEKSRNEKITENYKKFNIFNIWGLRSILGFLLVSVLGSITNGFTMIFFQNEVQYQKNIVLTNYLAYVLEILGTLFGGYLIQCPIFKRRLGFISIIGFSFIISLLAIFLRNNFVILLFNRFGYSGCIAVMVIYLNEAFPTMVKAEASASYRLISRITLIFAPFIMKSRMGSLIFLCSLNLISIFIIVICRLRETYQIPLQDLPDELSDI